MYFYAVYSVIPKRACKYETFIDYLFPGGNGRECFFTSHCSARNVIRSRQLVLFSYENKIGAATTGNGIAAGSRLQILVMD